MVDLTSREVLRAGHFYFVAFISTILIIVSCFQLVRAEFDGYKMSPFLGIITTIVALWSKPPRYKAKSKQATDTTQDNNSSANNYVFNDSSSGSSPIV